jgi:SAM-dependent methyltransferase
LREFVRRAPWLGRALSRLPFAGGARSSGDYWERRYAAGGDSGTGSEGPLAEFKAELLNALVAEHQVTRVVEFGCGDGEQLSLARYPEYVGLDVSSSVIARCRRRFESDPAKAFFGYDPNAFHDTLGLFRADLALSLDILYHLVEDEVFELHLSHLFGAATRFVVIYSSDVDRAVSAHVRHRHFTPTLEANHPDWELSDRIANPLPKHELGGAGSEADFFIYRRR